MTFTKLRHHHISLSYTTQIQIATPVDNGSNQNQEFSSRKPRFSRQEVRMIFNGFMKVTFRLFTVYKQIIHLTSSLVGISVCVNVGHGYVIVHHLHVIIQSSDPLLIFHLLSSKFKVSKRCSNPKSWLEFLVSLFLHFSWTSEWPLQFQ